MKTILEDICAEKKKHIAKCKAQKTESALLNQIKDTLPPAGFIRALKAKKDAGHIGLIAEIKKASPSKGVIRENFEPAQLAEAYAKGGATCLSVLTDVPFFQGDDAYLMAAKDASGLPALRKDFMLEPYQIIESRALGADCILLIMASLENTQAQELAHSAEELGMDILVEVHNEAELDRAFTHLSPAMLGINNRDLHTFTVDLAVTERLAKRAPAGTLLVSESGIYTHKDIERLHESGVYCFLVGESLMREDDVTAATQKLLGE